MNSSLSKVSNLTTLLNPVLLVTELTLGHPAPCGTFCLLASNFSELINHQSFHSFLEFFSGLARSSRSTRFPFLRPLRLVVPDCGAVPGLIGCGRRSGKFLRYTAGPEVILATRCHRRT